MPFTTRVTITLFQVILCFSHAHDIFQHPPPNALEGTNLQFPPLTHRSPVSWMLLRYRWQSWRTWGQNRQGWGMEGLVWSWASTHLP